VIVLDNAQIIDNRALAGGVFSLSIAAGEIASSARPGQFVNITCGFPGALLRRPISICGADCETLRLVFEVRGKGTAWLSERRAGDTLGVSGPHGNGFKLPDGGRTLLVGGGLGAAPLLFAAHELMDSCDAIIGFRGSGQIILLDEFERLCGGAVLTTDDGSAGLRGTVSEPLEEALSRGGYSAVLACGPRPMLMAAARICESFGVLCQVSLEERMACGMGACLVCACRTKGADGEETMSRVCRDGPVFDSREVVW